MRSYLLLLSFVFVLLLSFISAELPKPLKRKQEAVHRARRQSLKPSIANEVKKRHEQRAAQNKPSSRIQQQSRKQQPVSAPPKQPTHREKQIYGVSLSSITGFEKPMMPIKILDFDGFLPQNLNISDYTLDLPRHEEVVPVEAISEPEADDEI